MLLIDAVGALISAIMLGVILVRFEYLIGMPQNVLYLLAAIPSVFLIYDLISYAVDNANHRVLLRIIAFANLGYTLISGGLVYQHIVQLKVLGLVYFASEIIILIVLVRFELKLSSQKVAR